MLFLDYQIRNKCFVFFLFITKVLDEGIKTEEDEEYKQELETLKTKRLDAFKAKVEQLALWEEVEAKKSSFATKVIKGAIVTSPVIAGTFLTYKLGKWVWKEVTSYDEKEQEIPVSPFPIDKPAVYHFHPIAFVEQMRRFFDCCTSDWEYSDIKVIAYKSLDENIEKYLSGLNMAFKENEINSCLRKVHFLAQVLLESGGLKYTREIGASDSDYMGYPGRGLIQLTGKTNYESYQNYSGEDVTSNIDCKKKLERNPHAANSAGWFWHKNKLNEFADNNDFILITARINGGFNGYNSRLDYLKKGLELNCPTLKGISSNYNLSESGANNIPIYSFAWGLWHDPDLNKNGCTKSKNEALEGYNRLIELTDENFSLKNRYGINSLTIFDNIKDSDGNVKVRAAAQARINALSN